MLNNICLMGRITAEPVIKRTSNDIAVCTFDLAVQRSRRNKDGEKVTDFFRCEVWRKQAEFLGKYCHKGSMVVVNGELHNEKYVDKDGNNRTSTKVAVANIYIAAKKSDVDSGELSELFKDVPVNISMLDDELPF